MTRITLDPPRTPVGRLAEWWARRTFGAEMDPVRAMAHAPHVLRSVLVFERSVDRWRGLDPTLAALAVTATAATVGCSWCLDFGYWVNTQRGADPGKIGDVPRWRDSDRYSPLERQVLAYAEAVSSTPPQVTDEMVAALRRELGDAALVELTVLIGVENTRSRFNTALGLTGQGFRDRCEVPAGRS